MCIDMLARVDGQDAPDARGETPGEFFGFKPKSRGRSAVALDIVGLNKGEVVAEGFHEKFFVSS